MFTTTVHATNQAVLWCEGRVIVDRFSPLPVEAGQARVRMVAASICGADLRIVSGDKAAHREPCSAPIILGHEGCGVIEQLSSTTVGLKIGDFVVVLPHVHIPPEESGCTRTTTSITAACTSKKHTRHAGWDFDGTFCNVGIFPTDNLVVVSPDFIAQTERLVPDLGRALFTLTEPLLCCLSAYELMEQEAQSLLGHDVIPGRALVIGCGPIGVMHAMILAERGYKVSLSDPLPERVRLAQICLGGQGQILATQDEGRFDVVVVTANVLGAVRQAETYVSTDGILYLFAGLNARDRQAMHPDGVIFYEAIHRAARGVLTTTGDKRILYVGHSGYAVRLASQAIEMIAGNAHRLSALVTGVIPGFASPIIRSRTTSVADWRSSDGIPAIIPVLTGKADLRQHGKLIVLPGA